MKKIAIVLSLLLCLTLFVACGTDEKSNKDDKDNKVENEQTSFLDSMDFSEDVTKFMKYINEGEYKFASEYYNKKLNGNYESETEATEAITEFLNYINDEILKGQKTEKDSNKAIFVVEHLISETNIEIENFEEIKVIINSSVASKAAFTAAQNLENLKNYKDAITEYKKVIETDSNYSDAVSSIERCTKVLKQDIFTKAEKNIQDNEYIEAIELLEELKEFMPEDSEVVAKVTVYEKMYINNAIETASQKFITPTTDYIKALEIINSALQYYPENADLKDKKSYYESFAPVNLYDLEELKGSADSKFSDEDIYGNKYEKSFWAGYGNFSLWYKTDVSYYLNSNYNVFSATIYSRSTKNEAQFMTVKIYADDKIIYEKIAISDNSTQPFSFVLDVTGVSELRIVIDREKGAIGAGIGMTDMIVKRTVK